MKKMKHVESELYKWGQALGNNQHVIHKPLGMQ